MALLHLNKQHTAFTSMWCYSSAYAQIISINIRLVLFPSASPESQIKVPQLFTPNEIYKPHLSFLRCATLLPIFTYLRHNKVHFYLDAVHFLFAMYNLQQITPLLWAAGQFLAGLPL